MGWIIRLFLAAAGIIAGWFFVKDEPMFGVAQAFVAIILMALLVLVLALWPRRRHKDR